MNRRAPFEFLCIGAQKAGTTWLWEMLRHHPQVWMPPYKELHYFDRATTYPSNSFLADNNPLTRLLGREPRHRELRGIEKQLLQQAWKQRDLKALRWALNFTFGTYGDAWYASLFAGSTARMRGEITPSYSILDVEDIARIHRLAPDLKVIFLMRNPIERAWSQIRFDWTRGAFDAIDDMESVRAFIQSPRQELRSNYLRTLDLWESVFPKAQIHCGFYDDISTQPKVMLTTVLEFLGIDASAEFVSGILGRKFHVSKEKEIPAEIRAFLAEKYHPEIVKLSDRFGGVALKWREDVAAMKSQS